MVAQIFQSRKWKIRRRTDHGVLRCFYQIVCLFSPKEDNLFMVVVRYYADEQSGFLAKVLFQ